jgi:hypothetical protein
VRSLDARPLARPTPHAVAQHNERRSPECNAAADPPCANDAAPKKLRRRPTPQKKAAFLDRPSHQPAVTRARLAEFGAAFNARVSQRGLPPIEGPLQ